MLAGFEGDVTVVPAGGVTPPGVSVSEKGVWVAINSVEVGKTSGVGVGGAGVAGAAHPTNRVNPIKIAERVLVFIIISSLVNYISLIYLQQIL